MVAIAINATVPMLIGVGTYSNYCEVQSIGTGELISTQKSLPYDTEHRLFRFSNAAIPIIFTALTRVCERRTCSRGR